MFVYQTIEFQLGARQYDRLAQQLVRQPIGDMNGEGASGDKQRQEGKQLADALFHPHRLRLAELNVQLTAAKQLQGVAQNTHMKLEAMLK